ncbi:hypothetical protein Tco_0180164 [Tanacetum coccineum]
MDALIPCEVQRKKKGKWNRNDWFSSPKGSLLISEVTLELDTRGVEYGEEELRDRTTINHHITRSHPEVSRRRYAAANGSVDGRKWYDVKVLVDASDVDRVYEARPIKVIFRSDKQQQGVTLSGEDSVQVERTFFDGTKLPYVIQYQAKMEMELAFHGSFLPGSAVGTHSAIIVETIWKHPEEDYAGKDYARQHVGTITPSGTVLQALVMEIFLEMDAFTGRGVGYVRICYSRKDCSIIRPLVKDDLMWMLSIQYLQVTEAGVVTEGEGNDPCLTGRDAHRLLYIVDLMLVTTGISDGVGFGVFPGKEAHILGFLFLQLGYSGSSHKAKSTRPLLRQIRGMQESTARKARVWVKVEKSLKIRLQDNDEIMKLTSLETKPTIKKAFLSKYMFVVSLRCDIEIDKINKSYLSLDSGELSLNTSIIVT